MNQLSVTIRRKDGILWHGRADSLSTTNQLGVFDVLPSHAHFVGMVEQYIEVSSDVKKRWDIDRGIMSITDDIVEVYLDY